MIRTSRDYRLLAASGQLGYGIPAAAFEAGMEESPDVIGADMGSIDPGPYYLGSGATAAGQGGITHDLRMVLTAAFDAGTPVLIGNAGTAGRSDQVDLVRGTIVELVVEAERKCKLATIDSAVDHDFVSNRLHEGRIRPLSHPRQLEEQDILDTEVLVAQVGVEHWMQALAMEPDIVLAGRSLDTAIFSAAAIRKGYDRGLATHLGKILECTSLCAIPPGRDAALADLSEDSFTVWSCNSDRVCTPRSVAAHAFYEQADPGLIVEPGGHVNLSESNYEHAQSRAVRVSGSKWVRTSPYMVKIEGAKRIGWRAISIGGVFDPMVFKARDRIGQAAMQAAVRVASPTVRTRLIWSGGFDAPTEGIYPAMALLEVVAQSEDEAMSACGAAKQYLLHADYPGMLNNGGNIAYPFSPEVVSAGPAYEFSVYHLMELDDPLEIGQVVLEEIA